MHFRTYSDENPPERGTAKKIYNALKCCGFIVYDLHYNPNCWGRRSEDGWNTWACDVSSKICAGEFWCGWNEGRAYLQSEHAPFNVVWL